MESNCNYIPYSQTGYFSKIVSDYLNGSPSLRPFYQHTASLDGIKDAIKQRQSFATDRKLLVDELRTQYANLTLSTKQEAHLKSLAQATTFTITTAHQPNIFTGPLYFIYKIIHTIKLADELKQQLPDYNFVPVYYMGSEDADLDELGHIYLKGDKIEWQTKQTGAVGRMKVDKAFIDLINAVEGRIGIHPQGKELSNLFKQCYTVGKSIQQATLELVHQLFADFGLLILIPDNANLKRAFATTVEKELVEQFSHKAVEQTIKALGEHYKVQAGGRDLNLFYLTNDSRERIEVSGLKFKVASLKLEWNKDEILNELKNHPENFSANVILRGVFQETILPNIAFIGGGGELAYWLELKNVFAAAQVPYPVLVLRNSFLFFTNRQEEFARKLGFTIDDFFKSEQTLLNDIVIRNSAHQLNLDKEKQQLKELYAHLEKASGDIDPTLAHHVQSLHIKALKRIAELEKKMLRAEKKNFDVQQRHIAKLKEELFPKGGLQERTENFSIQYAKKGKAFLQTIYDASKGLSQEFCIIRI